jgi:tight adherence protein C
VELSVATLAVLVTGSVFMVVLAVVFAVRTLLNPERTARDRVADLTSKGGRAGADLLIQPSAQATGVAGRVGALARPQDEEEANLERRRLVQAGFRSRTNLEMYSAIRAALALAIPLVLWAVLPKVQLVYLAFFLMLGATAGYYIPSLYISNRLENRREELLKPFPDALDLLVSSVEAGLGLDAAFRRVSVEMEAAAPLLAQELQAVNNEVAAGVPRLEALRKLDHRTGLDEVNALVNVLMQADRFGTSVAKALRVHAELVRKKRMLAAEESAARISPKLTVAMILFILPGLIIVLAGPAFINIVRNLIPVMEGR